MQDAFAKAEKAGDYSSKEYKEAEAGFMLRHCASLVPDSPKCFSRPKVSGAEAYITAWGKMNSAHLVT